jgi:hypothetical protein
MSRVGKDDLGQVQHLESYKPRYAVQDKHNTLFVHKACQASALTSGTDDDHDFLWGKGSFDENAPHKGSEHGWQARSRNLW